MKRMMAAGLALMAAHAQAEEYPAPVEAVTEHGITIEAEFEAPGGMTGYVGLAQGQPLVLYLTPDKKQVIVGPMLDAHGHNLSEQHLAQHLPAPELDAIWEELEAADWVREGAEDAERVVYAFTDPECPYCNAFWRAARPYVGEQAQLRHIMVGVLRPSSLGKAARILGADEPAAALAEHERDKRDGGRGIAPLDPVPDDLEQRVVANNRLMGKLGVHATPAIFYRDRDGKVRQVMGMPKLSTIAEDIFQQPEQPIDDPALERFR